MKTPRRHASAALLLLLLVFGAFRAWGAVSPVSAYLWTGNGDGSNWSDAGNWDLVVAEGDHIVYTIDSVASSPAASAPSGVACVIVNTGASITVDGDVSVERLVICGAAPVTLNLGTHSFTVSDSLNLGTGDGASYITKTVGNLSVVGGSFTTDYLDPADGQSNSLSLSGTSFSVVTRIWTDGGVATTVSGDADSSFGMPSEPTDTTMFQIGSGIQVSSSEVEWTGGVDGDWNTNENWNPQYVPTSATAVTIPAGCANYPDISGDVNSKSVEVESGGSLAVSGGSLTVSGEISNSGALTFSGGTLDAGSRVNGPGSVVRYGGGATALEWGGAYENLDIDGADVADAGAEITVSEELSVGAGSALSVKSVSCTSPLTPASNSGAISAESFSAGVYSGLSGSSLAVSGASSAERIEAADGEISVGPGGSLAVTGSAASSVGTLSVSGGSFDAGAGGATVFGLTLDDGSFITGAGAATVSSLALAAGGGKLLGGSGGITVSAASYGGRDLAVLGDVSLAAGSSALGNLTVGGLSDGGSAVATDITGAPKVTGALTVKDAATFTLSGSPSTPFGSVVIEGGGTFSSGSPGSSHTIKVAGDWTVGAGGSFARQKSTVVFTADATVTGAAEFYTLAVDGITLAVGSEVSVEKSLGESSSSGGTISGGKIVFPGGADVYGANTFSGTTLTNVTAAGTASAATVKFADGLTQTFAGASFAGASGAALTLSTGGASWKADFSGGADESMFAYTVVDKSEAVGSSIPLDLPESGEKVSGTTSGGAATTKFWFSSKFFWFGGTNTNWKDRRNWSTKADTFTQAGSYPPTDGTAEITILKDESDGAKTLRLELSVDVKSLSVDGGKSLDLSGFDLTAGTLEVGGGGKIRLKGSESVKVGAAAADLSAYDGGAFDGYAPGSGATIEYYGTLGSTLPFGTAYEKLSFAVGAGGTVSAALSVAGTTTVANGGSNSLGLSGANAFAGGVQIGATVGSTTTIGGILRINAASPLSVKDGAECKSLELLCAAAFEGGLEAQSLTCEASGATLSFGGDVRLTSGLTIDGVVFDGGGHDIFVAPSAVSAKSSEIRNSRANTDKTTEATRDIVVYAKSGGAEICTDGGGNENWIFAGQEYEWTGASGTDWRTDGNWSPASPPGKYCVVRIPAGCANYPDLSPLISTGLDLGSGERTFAGGETAKSSILVESGGILDLGGARLTVNTLGLETDARLRLLGSENVGGIGSLSRTDAGGTGLELDVGATGIVEYHGAVGSALKLGDVYRKLEFSGSASGTVSAALKSTERVVIANDDAAAALNLTGGNDFADGVQIGVAASAWDGSAHGAGRVSLGVDSSATLEIYADAGEPNAECVSLSVSSAAGIHCGILASGTGSGDGVSFADDVSVSAGSTIRGKSVSFGGAVLASGKYLAVCADAFVLPSSIDAADLALGSFAGGSGTLSFPPGTTSVSIGGNLHVALAPDAALSVSAPISVSGGAEFRGGTLNLGGDLAVSGDFVALGADYDEDDDSTDSRSGVAGLFTYAHARRTAALHPASNFLRSAFPDGTTAFPELSAKIIPSSGVSVTVGGNFFSNGATLGGSDPWTLEIPAAVGSSSAGGATPAFAEAHYTTASGCTVGTANAAVAAAEGTTAGGCVGWATGRTRIKAARTAYDDVIFVEFVTVDAAGNESPAAIENSHDEISAAARNATFLSGGTPVAFLGAYTNKACTVSTDGRGDIAAGSDGVCGFYLKAGFTWNTDATGTDAGSGDSTDRSGYHRDAIPRIDLPKAAASVYATLRDTSGNRLAHFSGADAFTAVEDGAAPVLAAVYTGQELHEDDPASQRAYDAHNFIEFRYSEPVDVGTMAAADGGVNVQASELDDSDATGAKFGGKVSNSGGLSVAGFARFASGSLVAGYKTGSAGSWSGGEDPARPHAFYRTFDRGGGEEVQPCRVRLSVAGYSDESNPVSSGGSSFRNYLGYIESAATPSGAVTPLANKFVKDAEGNVLDHAGATGHALPALSVSSSGCPLYGGWDVSAPVFAPYVDSLEAWTAGGKTGRGGKVTHELVGTVRSATNPYVEKIEMHLFDNAPDYSSSSRMWVVRTGWVSSSNTSVTLGGIAGAAPDATGGSRDALGSPSAATAGGIRRSSLDGAESAFLYKFTLDGHESGWKEPGSGGIGQSASSPVFRNDDYHHGTTVTKDDGLYLSVPLGADDYAAGLPTRTLFTLTYDTDAGFVTDLAGNRLRECDPGSTLKTVRSLDVTPPTFALTLAPVGSDRLLAVFTKPLSWGGKKLGSLSPSEWDGFAGRVVPTVEFVPSAGDDVETTASPDSPISVTGVSLALETDDSTALSFSLSRSVTLTDVKTLWVRVRGGEETVNIFGEHVVMPFLRDDAGNSVLNNTCHAASDFALNAVEALYAYAGDDGVDGDSWDERGIFGTGLSDPIYQDYVVRDFSENAGNYGRLPSGRDVMFQFRYREGVDTLGNSLAPSDGGRFRVLMNRAADVQKAWLGDKLARLTGRSLRVWLASELDSYASGHCESPSWTMDGAERASGSSLLWNLRMGADVCGFSSGGQFQFVCQLLDSGGNVVTINHDGDTATERVPLYALWTPESRISAGDLLFADLWSFTLVATKRQRGGVSVLNNVIDANVREKTVIKVELPSDGNLNVYVLTLDGSVVARLSRGRKSAGTHYFYWDGTNGSGSAVARGIYFVRVSGSGIDETRKVLVTK